MYSVDTSSFYLSSRNAFSFSRMGKKLYVQLGLQQNIFVFAQIFIFVSIRVDLYFKKPRKSDLRITKKSKINIFLDLIFFYLN